MKSSAIPLLIGLALVCSCRSTDAPLAAAEPTPPATPGVEVVDILALGDSYTKGQGIPAAGNFPNQLADSLRAAGRSISGVYNIAQTGWRTDQLIGAINSQPAVFTDSIFSIVTLCIGVNNQFQNGSLEVYRMQFEQLLQLAIAKAGGRKNRVFVLSIPDYAFTPYGNGSADISLEIDQFNAANAQISQQYGVAYILVTDISRQGLQQPDLVAGDGLHPSAKQYAEWVKRMKPIILSAL